MDRFPFRASIQLVQLGSVACAAHAQVCARDREAAEEARTQFDALEGKLAAMKAAQDALQQQRVAEASEAQVLGVGL